MNPEELHKQGNEYVRDVFNRLVTYFMFHITTNYTVLGWLATHEGRLTQNAATFLTWLFCIHNVCGACVFWRTWWWLRGSVTHIMIPETMKKPPYVHATFMMAFTLAFMVVVWIVARCWKGVMVSVV